MKKEMQILETREECYPDQNRYEDFCRQEYEQFCLEEYAKRIKHLKKADNTLNILADRIKTAEGVYVHIDSKAKKEFIKKYEIPTDENVLFLDMNLSLLQPKPLYIDLLKSIGISEEQCTATIQGFYTHERENGKLSVYPDIQGGGYNPYLKYKSNRSTANRRLQIIKLLSRLIKKKIYMMNLNLTFPAEISSMLFNDPDGQKKVSNIEKLFWDLSKGIFTLDINEDYQKIVDQRIAAGLNIEDASYVKDFLKDGSNWFKVSFKNKKDKFARKARILYSDEYVDKSFILDFEELQDFKQHYAVSSLEFGKFSNSHDWGDINPFEDHVHIHPLFANFFYDRENKIFVRLKPFLNSTQISSLKKIFYLCQKKILHYGENTDFFYSTFDIDFKKLNIFFQYLPGFQDVDRPEKVEFTLSNQAEFQQYITELKDWKHNNKSKCRLLHTLKYTNRSYIIDVANYFDYHDSDYPDSYEDFLEKSNQFKKFVDRGGIENRTSCTGFFRNVKQLIMELDWNLYRDLYDVVTGKPINDYRDTLSCAVTGEKISRNREYNTDFLGMKRLAIFIAYKSHMIRIGELTFSAKPFPVCEKKPNSVAVDILKMEDKVLDKLLLRYPDKICPECDLIVDIRDYNFSKKCCRYCTSPAHSLNKKSEENYEKGLYDLSRLNKELAIHKRNYFIQNLWIDDLGNKQSKWDI